MSRIIGAQHWYSVDLENRYPLAIAFLSVSVRLAPGLSPCKEPLNSQNMEIPCLFDVWASTRMPTSGISYSFSISSNPAYLRAEKQISANCPPCLLASDWKLIKGLISLSLVRNMPDLSLPMLRCSLNLALLLLRFRYLQTGPRYAPPDRRRNAPVD